ncbi:MAG: hypothetical protein AAGA03_02135 [Planctomycetota bacterium]
MRVSILSFMIATLVAGITYGTSAADDNLAAYGCVGAVSLFMTCTLAIPFTCQNSRRPFWAAYGTTTAYAMLVRGEDDDPFSQVFLLPILYVVGDLSEPSIMRVMAHGLHLWTPVLAGLFAGLCFSTIVRLSGYARDLS